MKSKFSRINELYNVNLTQLTDSQVMDLFILIRQKFVDISVTVQPIAVIECGSGQFLSIGDNFNEAVVGLLGQVYDSIDRDKVLEVLTREYVTM